MPILSPIGAATSGAFGLPKSASGSAGDPYYEYVTLLLTGDGTNGAQNNTFLDSSSNAFTITRNGNTTQGSFSPYGSLWSNYFNGTTDYLNGPTNNSAFDFSTGDFTVECWVFATSSSDASIYTNFGPSGAGGLELVTSSGYLFVWNHTAASLSMTSNTLLPLNQWVHVAVTRSGNNFTIWQNGVSVATQTISVTLKTNASSPVCIGGIYSGGGVALPSWKGYISNLRVTKGGCLYTTTFTPSTTPLTTTVASGTVSWLTCQSNRFADSSANAFAMTTGGTPSVQRFSPFNPTASYDTATIGGSGYFDGSGDYLTVPDSADWDFGTGDFTVECWVYPLDNSSTMMMVSQYDSSNGFSLQWNTGTTLYWYKGGTQLASFSNAIKAFQWNHVVAVRSGTVFRLYVNGVGNTAISDSTNFSGATTPLTIGNISSLYSQPFNGNIDDVRIVKGTAVYDPNSATLTVPTAPLTAITNTKFLCNFTNAGIPDSAMMNDLETVGNAQVSTSVKKFGTGSIYLDGTSDCLNVYAPVVKNYGTGDFTWEGWFYFNNVTNEAKVYDGRTTGATSFMVYIQSGTLRFFYNGADRITSSSLSTSTWYHIAIVRNSGVTKMYLDGTQTGSSYTDANNYTAGDGKLYLFATDASGSQCVNGYIDDFRITNGYARYTANFTPPTAAFPTY